MEQAGAKFLAEMYQYMTENLIRVHIYINSPFVKQFVRAVDTTLISYIANIGGLMGLCMGFSFVSLAEIIYYLWQAAASMSINR